MAFAHIKKFVIFASFFGFKSPMSFLADPEHVWSEEFDILRERT
jgi:hypothetical protein